MLPFIVIALGVPGVVAGPDLATEATAVEAPITEVTVYSDRARIVRAARAPSGAGVVALRFPDLPGALQIDSLRLTATGGKVLRVEATPVQRSRRSIDQVDALLDAIEAKQDQLDLIRGRRTVHAAEAKALAALAPAPLPELEDRAGRAAKIGSDGWIGILDRIEQRQATLDQIIARLDAEARTVGDALRLQQAELAEYDLAAFSAERIELVALIERTAPAVTLRAEYLVPGARWTPVYAIERDPKADRITVRTAGLVTQTTGEDWMDVQVTLSTAIPSARIGMPTLQTWTLGESRDFVLQPQPKRTDAQHRMAPVQPQTPVDRLYADWSLGQLRGRVAAARSAGPGGADRDADGIPDSDDRCPGSPETYNGYSDTDGCPDHAAPQKEMEMQRRRAEAIAKREVTRAAAEEARRPSRDMNMKTKPAMAPPPPAEPLADEAPMAFDGDYGGETLEISSAGSLAGYASRANVRHQAMGLFDNRVIGRGPIGPAGSPARLVGGLDYRYRATTRMTLPSTPEAQRVPLAVDTWSAIPFYAAAPGIETTAYLKATVKNDSGRPLLAGPVNIFVGTDFVGQGQLETTGAGATLDLPLGADEDIKIVRRVLPRTKTEGVFSADDVTVYGTEIEIGNYKKRPIRIRIAEQVPLSGHEKVKVERGSLSPKPAEGPDAQGLMAFDLTIAPGKTERIRFDYTVTRPENWQLRQQ